MPPEVGGIVLRAHDLNMAVACRGLSAPSVCIHCKHPHRSGLGGGGGGEKRGVVSCRLGRALLAGHLKPGKCTQQLPCTHRSPLGTTNALPHTRAHTPRFGHRGPPSPLLGGTSGHPGNAFQQRFGCTECHPQPPLPSTWLRLGGAMRLHNPFVVWVGEEMQGSPLPAWA